MVPKMLFSQHCKDPIPTSDTQTLPFILMLSVISKVSPPALIRTPINCKICYFINNFCFHISPYPVWRLTINTFIAVSPVSFTTWPLTLITH